MHNKKALIIGYGRMGRIYFEILSELGFKSIDIIEKNKLKIDNKKDFKSKKVRIYSSCNADVKKKDYFIVIVSTTTDKKFEFIEKIASKKIKYLYIEKPIACSLADCRQIEKIKKKFKLKIGVNHQSRFTQEIEDLFQMVKNYKKDELISINLIAGNIGIAMNGTHIIELFNFLIKKPIIKVSANFEKKLSSNPRGKKFKDFAGQIFCKNSDNRTLTINTSNNQSHGFNIFFNFKNGFIFLDYLSDNIYFNFRKKKYFYKKSNFYGLPSVIKRKKITTSSIKFGTKKNISKFLNDKKVSSIEDSINVVKILSAAYYSSLNKGATVEINNFKKNFKFKWA